MALLSYMEEYGDSTGVALPLNDHVLHVMTVRNEWSRAPVDGGWPQGYIRYRGVVHRRFIAIHPFGIDNHPLTLHPPPSTASLPVRSRLLVTAPLQRRPELLTPGPSRHRTQDGAQENRQPDTLHACTFLFGHGYWRNGAIAGLLIFLAVFGS
jgi:hypothetical protein